ncbi:MAG: hypothetical protein WA069_03455 [Candidatus Moraniibacteriota bacterium]
MLSIKNIAPVIMSFVRIGSMDLIVQGMKDVVENLVMGIFGFKSLISRLR